MESIGLAAESQDPTWLALHPSRPLLFATNELISYEGQESGSVSAFTIDKARGRLTLINRVSSQGMNPSVCRVDATGRWLIVDNYGGAVEGPGSVAVFAIAADGRLGDRRSRKSRTRERASIRGVRRLPIRTRCC